MSPIRHRFFPGLLVVWLALASVASGQYRETRTWTSNDGRTLEGSLLHADGDTVRLRLSDGREFDVPLDRLGEKDREYVAAMRSTGRTLAFRPMPGETKIDPQIEVEGGPRNFVTPHFEFGTDHGVSKSFISEAARVFEGTLHAVASLPLGIEPKPAQGAQRFRTLFLDRSTFEREIAEVMTGVPQNPGSIVAGIYIPKRQEVLVPFSSLETGRSGSQITLRRTSDTSTLIHEIVHQVMHDWLALTPVWFSEGLAEYVAAVPYQNGRFEFRNAPKGLRETLESQYGIREGMAVPMIHPADFLEMRSADWRGSQDDYRSAMLLVYYFMHLDQPDKPGAALAGYLHLLEQGRDETENFIADHNRLVDEFEKKRLAYNEAVDRYNADLVRYRAEVDAYNERVTAYNRQLEVKTPAEELIEVGEEPKAPAPPERPEIPEQLRDNSAGGTIDMAVMMHNTARPALVRDRDLDQLGDAVAEALKQAGIPVRMMARGEVYRPHLNPVVAPQSSDPRKPKGPLDNLIEALKPPR